MKVMNYHELDALLQGRCRERRKLENNTYLERHDFDSIAVRFHSTDILTFHPNGKIDVSSGGWNTVTTRDRLRRYLPEPWNVCSYRGATVLYRHSAAFENGWLVDNSATIWPNGKVTASGTFKDYLEAVRREDNERRRESSRLNRWLQKARGLHIDNSTCTKKDWCHCHPRHGGWGRRHRNLPTQAGMCENCGCRVHLRQPDRGRLTVADVLAEPNASIRVAKMKVYGVEAFFLDAKPTVRDENAGYQLLEIRMGSGWNEIVKALKMSCPSTSAVYVSMVPPHIQTVSDGLDWMFQTENYLERIGQAS